jgi:hypothetical protein
MTITNESYTLTSNYNGDWAGIAVFNAFSSAGESDADSTISGNLTYSVNGGTATVGANWGGWQYRPGFEGAYDSNDVAYLIALPSGTWSLGDIVTINATLVMNSALDADIILPNLVTTESQTALTGQRGQIISSTHTIGSSVPEPSSALLFSVAASLGILRRNRRG